MREHSESWKTESEVVNGWIEPAVREAERKAGRIYLLRLLRLRFGPGLPDGVMEMIQAQTDVQTLHDWFDAAITAESAAMWLAFAKGQEGTRE